jgi:hypothetical protein
MMMTEIWVDSHLGSPHGSGGKDDPVSSISHALSLLSGIRDKLWVRGVFKDGLKLKFLTPDSLVIDGQNDTNFDPLKPTARTWGNIAITDCHNLTLKNLAVWGGNMHGIYLEDGYPKTGLKNITLDNITVRHAHQRGIFMGGHNIRDVIIKNCDVRDSVFDGPETHGIYLSGGHWRHDYGVFDIQVLNTTVAYSFGRHAIQFNGRCRGMKIEGCTCYHAEMPWSGTTSYTGTTGRASWCMIMANPRFVIRTMISGSSRIPFMWVRNNGKRTLGITTARIRCPRSP